MSWYEANLAKPLTWTMVAAVVGGMTIGALTHPRGNGMVLALVLLITGLLIAAWVAAIALQHPDGADRRQLLKLAGWSCVILLGLSALLRYRQLGRILNA